MHLDDFLILGHTKIECAQHTQELLQMLADLGLEVNVPKSVLVPEQVLQYLGFVLDLLDGRVVVTSTKITHTVGELARLANRSEVSLRAIAGALGKVRSLLFALPQARLLTDKLLLVLQLNANLPWESTVSLQQEVISQLESTIEVLKVSRGRKFVQELPPCTIYSDASDQGGSHHGGVTPRGSVQVVSRPESAHPHQSERGRSCMGSTCGVQLGKYTGTLVHRQYHPVVVPAQWGGSVCPNEHRGCEI